MATTKHLRPWASSSSDDDEVETSSQTPSAPSASTVAAATVTRKGSYEEGEDNEEHSSDESSSEEEEEPKDKKQTPSATVVSAAKTNKAKKKEVCGSNKAKKKEVCGSSEAQKRPSEGTSTEDMNDAKRAKKVHKLLSEEDEIRVLQGILDFKSKTGKTTNEDKKGFYEFIKESLTVEVSFSQCIEKIKTLRRKFMNKWKKEKKPAFSKGHDVKVFELSKMIWGSNADEKSSKSERIKKIEEDKEVKILKQGEDWFNNSFLVRSIASFGIDKDSVKTRWSMVPPEKKKKFEDRLRVLQAEEFELVSQKTKLLHEAVSMIVEASSQ